MDFQDSDSQERAALDVDSPPVHIKAGTTKTKWPTRWHHPKPLGLVSIPAGTEAGQRLQLALVDLAAQGQRPRCSDPGTRDYWTSADRAERDLAVSWCAGCPLIEPCHQAAEAQRESFGVWAGIDRTRSKRNR